QSSDLEPSPCPPYPTAVPHQGNTSPLLVHSKGLVRLPPAPCSMCMSCARRPSISLPTPPNPNILLALYTLHSALAPSIIDCRNCLVLQARCQNAGFERGSNDSTVSLYWGAMSANTTMARGLETIAPRFSLCFSLPAISRVRRNSPCVNSPLFASLLICRSTGSYSRLENTTPRKHLRKRCLKDCIFISSASVDRPFLSLSVSQLSQRIS
ncbi:hypothetical protein BKA66DRAFT_597722, partial [Pyrenochaeta sp. MPI-SDFR-AT-0127]